MGLRPWFSHELTIPHHRGSATPNWTTHRATPNWTTHRATPNWTTHRATPNWTTAKWTTAKWTTAKWTIAKCTIAFLGGVALSNLERLRLQRALSMRLGFVL